MHARTSARESSNALNTESEDSEFSTPHIGSALHAMSIARRRHKRQLHNDKNLVVDDKRLSHTISSGLWKNAFSPPKRQPCALDIPQTATRDDGKQHRRASLSQVDALRLATTNIIESPSSSIQSPLWNCSLVRTIISSFRSSVWSMRYTCRMLHHVFLFVMGIHYVYMGVVNTLILQKQVVM